MQLYDRGGSLRPGSTGSRGPTFDTRPTAEQNARRIQVGAGRAKLKGVLVCVGGRGRYAELMFCSR